MQDWQTCFRIDPLPGLLAAGDEALTYFVRRDLLAWPDGPPGASSACLWALPEPTRLLKKQLPNGAWPRPAPNPHPAVKVELVETWRNMRVLVEQYGFTRQHPAAARAAEFIFSCQSPDSDLRGILANQYATYYTGAIFAILVQAGYARDPRLLRGLDWLLAMRQEDGGWTIPMLTHKLSRQTQYHITTEFVEPLEPDRMKPFSHNWTGMVLRAFAVHPDYSLRPEIRHAAGLLAARFFQPDVYTSYQSASYWLRFDYPFWWNTLVSALDSISRIGLSPESQPIQHALNWLVEHQQEDGLWDVAYPKPGAKAPARAKRVRPWVSLAICRVFKRFYQHE